MRANTPVFSAAVILLVLGSPVFAYRQLIDLGTLGGQQSCAYSINDNGQIVGWAGQNPSSSGDPKACLFDASGGGANINLQPGGFLIGGAAQSINNKGQIVGWGSDPINGNYACLFDSTGGGANKYLQAHSSQSGRAYSINDSGQIVGQLYVGSLFYHACVFDSTGNGANKDLGSGCAYSNNASEVVGSRTQACIFDISGGGADTYLGALGGSQSNAWSINDAGQIVGYARINNDTFPNNPIIHACIFDSTGDGFNIDLGTLGGSGSEALSINDMGQIVGWALLAPDSQNPFSSRHACLFDPTGHGNNIDLNTLIDPGSGWVLEKAYCINNSGWIVGEGAYHGGERAFLLTPEPTTLLLFGLGVSLLRRKK
jgi:uncharacterized membrane protein